MRHAIEQDDVADEHGIAAAQPLLPDAGGEAVRVDMGADVVERVAEGRRVLHYRAQRTVYIVALARRQTHAEIRAVQRCGSVFDERDGLSVRRARKAVRCVGGSDERRGGKEGVSTWR